MELLRIIQYVILLNKMNANKMHENIFTGIRRGEKVLEFFLFYLS